MKTLAACVVLALFATPAHAVGIDMTVGACPGNAGASADAGALDCAGGQSLTLLCTFMPNESIPDLVGVDVRWDLVVAGDLFSDAAFWEMETANPAALASDPHPPATGCPNYAYVWGDSGGSATLGFPLYPSRLRIAAIAYNGRGQGAAVTANQRIFALSLIILTANSTQAGGALPGCDKPVCIALSGIVPRAISGNDGTTLSNPSVFGTIVSVNGGATGVCLATPARRHTWGQLKTLYR